MKWLVFVVGILVILYLGLFGLVTFAMTRPPEQFGQIIKHLPMPVVWGIVPGPKIWMWARKGTLQEGDIAPDFTLMKQGGNDRVTLSAFRGQKPVVLVFGSYT